MGALDNTVRDILRQSEQEDKDLLRNILNPEAELPLPGTPGSVGGSQLPGATTPEAGTPPSFLSRLFGGVGRGFEISGEAASITGQAQSLQGQEMIRLALRGAQIIDTPLNAIRVGFHRALTTRPLEKPKTLPGLILPSRRDFGFIAEGAGVFKDQTAAFGSGVADGWKRKEVREVSEVFDEAIFGPDAEAKLNNYLDDKPLLKLSKSGFDLVTNIGIEATVDAAVAVGAFKIAKPVTRVITAKAPIVARGLAGVAPKTFVKIHWDDMVLPGENTIRKGFSPWVHETAKLNTTVLGRNIGEADINEVILNSIMKDVPVGRTIAIPEGAAGEPLVFATKFGRPETRGFARIDQFDELATQSAINKLNIKRADSVKRFGDIEDRILHQVDPKIVELDQTLTIHENLVLPNFKKVDDLSRRLDTQFMNKEFLIKQQDLLRSEIDAIDGRLRTVSQGLLRDPLGIDTARIVKTKYIDEYIRVNKGAASVTDELDSITNIVSNGRTKDIGELRDTEFFAMFDFLDMGIKDAEDFVRLPKRVQPVPPGGDWFTPAWMWFERRGAGNVFHVVDQGDIANTKLKQWALQKWEEAAETINPNIKKVFNDDDLQKRLFWYANNGKIEGRDRAAYFAEVKRLGLSETEIAREINMANIHKEVMDEFGEMAIVQGKLTRDGSGAPRRLDDYVYHQFDDIVEREIANKTEFNLLALNRPFEFRANTKIDIDQFKRRLANRDDFIENLDTSFRAASQAEPWALKMEPAMKSAVEMARLSGSDDIIGYTRDWINYSVRGMPTKNELRSEKYFDWFGRNILENGTAWLPERLRFVTKDRAAKQILSGYRRATFSGALGFNISSVAKQGVQGLQGTAFVGAKHSGWAYRSLFTEGGKDLLENMTVRIGRFAGQTFDVNNLSHIERWGMRGFTWADQWPNVSKTFNESLHWGIVRRQKNIDIVKRFGPFSPWTDVNRSSKTLNKAIQAGHFRKEVEMANFITRTAQYGYRNFDMPRHLWGQWGKTLGQFTSWPANYYYSFLPELAKWTLTGTGPGGIRLGRWERMALLRHYVNNTTIWAIGQAAGMDLARHLPPRPVTTFPFFNLGGPAPTRPSPFAQGLQGMAKIGAGETVGSKKIIQDGKSQFARSFTFLPPLFIRNIIAVSDEKKDILDLVAPRVEE